ncbi:MAG: UDP-N-acetylmuramate--L-alanine ligase [Bacteroidota bacterium]
MKNIFFLGIGGIGMSALAKYFHAKGYIVSGYDKTSTPLTKSLEQQGIKIHFTDDEKNIPNEIKNNSLESLIVITPAIPKESIELNFFLQNNYTLIKRAAILGEITKGANTIAVAGTHGKTTTSTLVAHLMKEGEVDCSAFLGGISSNFNSNLLIGKDNCVVVEADEYDRSFLTLSPSTAIVTSVDPDHLDIYHEHKNLKESFELFTEKILANGNLIVKLNLDFTTRENNSVKKYTYSIDGKSDFFASDIQLIDGLYLFTLNTPSAKIENLELGMAGLHNLENAIAASAAALLNGISSENLKNGLKTFRGVKRRFEYIFRNQKLVYLDDYAHHPEELLKCIESVKTIFPNKKITGIFQPHLFSRTRDFMDDFAKSLSMLDKCILLDIYPAREIPIPGITSDLLLAKITSPVKEKMYLNNIVNELDFFDTEVLLTLGAGDIDTIVEPLKQALINYFKN